MNVAGRKYLWLAALAVAATALSGCELQRAQRAADAKTAMVGLTREQVLACMGPPAERAATGNTEVWTYNSGNGRTDTVAAGSAWGGRSWADAFGTSTTESRYCKVSVVMSGARVSRINYAGPTGGLLTEGEQCGFAVANCADTTPYLATALGSSQDVPIGVPPPAPAPPPRESAVESAEQPPADACSKQDRELARMAREKGYRYDAACL